MTEIDGATYSSPEAAQAAIEALASETAAALAKSGKPATDAAPEPEEPEAASAPEETPADSPEEPAGEPPTEEEPPAKGGSTLFDKVLQKYGGDTEKLAEAIVHGWNSGSQLNAQLAYLTHVVSSLQQAKDEPIDVSQDPDIQDISEQIAAHDADLADIARTQQSLSAKLEKQNGKVYVLRGKIEAAVSDEEAARLKSDLESAEEKLQDIIDEYNDTTRVVKRVNREKASAERLRERATKLAENRVREARAQAALDSELDVRTRESFDSAVAKEMERRKIPQSEFDRLRASLANEFRGFVATLPEGAGAVDFDRWVPAAFAIRHGEEGSAAFRKQSAEKGRLLAKKPSAQPAKGSIVPPQFDKLPLEERLRIAERYIDRRM